MANQQAEALADWANQYLSDINQAIQILDADVETLPTDQQHALARSVRIGTPSYYDQKC